MGVYTLTALVSVALVLALELVWLRTGLLRTLRFWLAMVIVLGFQVPVDGWLTKLSDPIVIYHPDQMLGIRAPWDIPIEDYGFGFAMVTLTIMLWRRLVDRSSSGGAADQGTVDQDAADDETPVR
jgi:lycopene cyclase domain-containing protein